MPTDPTPTVTVTIPKALVNAVERAKAEHGDCYCGDATCPLRLARVSLSDAVLSALDSAPVAPAAAERAGREG